MKEMGHISSSTEEKKGQDKFQQLEAEEEGIEEERRTKHRSPWDANRLEEDHCVQAWNFVEDGFPN